MADIRPFQAVRPDAQFADQIAALPYDVYNREEAKAVVAHNPLSFLKIDRAETNFPDDISTYAPCVYEKAHALLGEMIQNGQLIKEDKPVYYLYRLIMNGRSQTGIVACASIDDYCDGVIKKHENTREEKELDRIRHIDICNAQTGPIFLAFRRNETIENVVLTNMSKTPVYDFVSEDKTSQTVWVIDSESDIAAIQNAFLQIQQIYIADGHHRCASAVKVGLQRREEGKKKESDYFLSVLFPENELEILDYNRVIKDLNHKSVKQILEELSVNFTVTEKQDPVKPEKKGQFGMYLDHKWYLLTLQKQILSDDCVECLDVSILQKYVLHDIFDIEDPKTDKRIDFIGGIRGLEELERRVHSDCKIAFSMYPTSIEELFAVADAGRLMPPKSTWFEPKLQSGLFIHQI